MENHKRRELRAKRDPHHLNVDNGDIEETTTEKRSSCEKKLRNCDAAYKNEVREENRAEG